MRGGSDPDRRRDQRVALHVGVFHRTDQLGDLLDTAIVAPGFEVVDDLDQRRRIAETRIADADRACGN